MCYPTGSGETGQVWSWKQRTSSKKGELAWMEAAARLPHHCSNLPLSLASPAGKLSRPGAIWSSPWCLHPSARQLSSSDNHEAGRRTTYSMSKIKWKMTVICDTHRKNSYPRHFWGICPLYHRESFLFFWKGFSQWGSPGGDFQRHAMPPEPLRHPRETTAGDCTVSKKDTEIPETCNVCNPCQSLAFKCLRAVYLPIYWIMRQQK